MNVEELRASITEERPPEGLSHPLAALWWEAKGDWDQAHTAAQKDPGSQGCAVHAYLHRVEGDLRNAGYWYDRAGRPVASDGLAEEWARLARELLA